MTMNVEKRCAAVEVLRWACFVLVAFAALACQAQERTLEELKAEAQKRADHNAYPFIGLSADDVREALSHVTSLDSDAWAAAWGALGDRYAEKGRSEKSSKAADDNFIEAWLFYTMARWPVPNSPGKEKAYEKAREAYLAHGKLLTPPLEVIKIPFEGKEIKAYLQMPKGVKEAPIVVGIGGLDSRKEDMAERLRPLLAYGIGYLALDPPGGGESPIKAAPGAERMLVRAVDYLFERPDVDKKRVVIYGSSLGGYWSTLLAALEGNRLCAVVSQSPPIDETFARSRTMALAKNREYLFGFVQAQLFMYEGATNLETLADVRERMSLKKQGLLDKAMAPMLVIGGVQDTQVPIADVDLLLHSGQTPKEAWINPQGGHMGRDPKVWSDPMIFQQVTMPWIVRRVAARSEPSKP
ncbi:MAG: alpha/beta hydrolase family protein [Candidatus Sulfotelmatobacter sp.]